MRIAVQKQNIYKETAESMGPGLCIPTGRLAETRGQCGRRLQQCFSQAWKEAEPYIYSKPSEALHKDDDDLLFSKHISLFKLTMLELTHIAGRHHRPKP